MKSIKSFSNYFHIPVTGPFGLFGSISEKTQHPAATTTTKPVVLLDLFRNSDPREISMVQNDTQKL